MFKTRDGEVARTGIGGGGSTVDARARRAPHREGQLVVVVLEGDTAQPDIDRLRDAIAGLGGLEQGFARGYRHQALTVLVDDPVRFCMELLTGIPGVRDVITSTTPYPLVSAGAGGRSTVRVGNTEIGPTTFSLIAGPCAIETPGQARAAWRASVAGGATVLRGDVFKHRTSPYSFQGLGAEGIELLAAERRRLGLPVVVEVLSPRDIEEVADVVDMIRVGARNMQNRELLLACGQAGIPVMLKRGLAATIEEWLLSAETVASAGNLDIVLCERGIRTFEAATRNTLDLSAVVVAQQKSRLPVIVDPSHASGHRHLVAPLALAAVAAGADGVMLDVHPSPETALCDGPQAILPPDVVGLGARLSTLARWMGRSTAHADNGVGNIEEAAWVLDPASGSLAIDLEPTFSSSAHAGTR